MKVLIDMNLSPKLRQFQDHLDHGALISVDEKSRRVRILPLVNELGFGL